MRSTGVLRFSAHYYAYAKPAAVDFVLKNFRAFCPTNPVDLVVDGGGLDLSDLAAEYNCRYFQEAYRVDCTRPLREENFKAWLCRLLRTALSYDLPWVMLLEDDVLVRGHVLKEPRFDLVGTEKHHDFFRGPLRRILANDGKLVNRGCGGTGGSLLRKASLLEAASRYYNEGSWLHEHLTCTDQLLTAIFMSAGFQYGHDPYFTECWDPGWQTNGAAVVHAYKKYC